MNVLRITNLYLLGRSFSPEYFVCSSFYKIDKNAVKRMRALCSSKEYYCNNKYNNTQVPHQQNNYRRMQLTSKQLINAEDVTTQVLSVFKTIQMEDMKLAPHPVFWYSSAALLPLIGPPLSFLIFGYSPFLATLQLAFGATLCSFAGGMKWGYALNNPEHEPTWENLGWAIVPQLIGWLSLLVPQSLGFLLVTGGIALSTFVDLTATNYPCWFKAIRLALTIPAIIGLLLAFVVRLFH